MAIVFAILIRSARVLALIQQISLCDLLNFIENYRCVEREIAAQSTVFHLMEKIMVNNETLKLVMERYIRSRYINSPIRRGEISSFVQ